MNDTFERLKTHIARGQDLNKAANVLSWDQEINMPPGGTADRANQLSTLRGMAHELFTADEIGQMLDDLAPLEEELDYDSNEAAMLRAWRKRYQKAVKVPVEWVERHARATSEGHESWVKARARNQFELFSDDLSRIIDLKREWAGFFPEAADIYDPHLDAFQEGTTYDQIEAIFSGMKPHLIELAEAIAPQGDAVDSSILHREISAEQQVAFGKVLAATVGYDFTRGRLDQSSHPFSTFFGLGDVRITTRVIPGNFFYCFKSSIHESGHAIHGQSFDPGISRTGLDTTGGTVISESQSRFYENIIGRSRAFWRHMFPQVQAFFAPTFDDISAEDFYRAVNEVTPSLIRVRADEVTYGLHVVLRFELEHALINEELAIADLPQAWNDRMESYLGIVPPTDTDGVLQDIHWSAGLFGYFPGYQLGSMFSVQLWDAMQADHPDISSEFERGQFDTAHTWLKTNIMQHGAKFTLPEITQRAIGGDLSYEPYIRYLHDKFGDIYQL